MKINELKILHNGRCSDVVCYRPDGLDKYPVVIFSHGYNGHKSDFEISAKYFAENGIGAVCHTFCGGSTRDESGFGTRNMTLFTEEEDLTAIVNEVKQWTETEKIFLFGASQGGMVSAMTAENMEEDIQGLILLYPAFCILDNWQERFPKEEDIPDCEELWGMMLGRRFFEAIHGLKLRQLIGKYSNNVLIMHGTEDVVVPYAYAEWAEKTYRNARLETFAHEGHGFSEEGNRRMEAMAMYFLHDCLKK